MITETSDLKYYKHGQRLTDDFGQKTEITTAVLIYTYTENNCQISDTSIEPRIGLDWTRDQPVISRPATGPALA